VTVCESRKYVLILAILVFLMPTSQPSYPQESDLEDVKVLEEQVENLAKQSRYAEAIPITEKILGLEN